MIKISNNSSTLWLDVFKSHLSWYEIIELS